MQIIRDLPKGPTDYWKGLDKGSYLDCKEACSQFMCVSDTFWRRDESAVCREPRWVSLGACLAVLMLWCYDGQGKSLAVIYTFSHIGICLSLPRLPSFGHLGYRHIIWHGNRAHLITIIRSSHTFTARFFATSFAIKYCAAGCLSAAKVQYGDSVTKCALAPVSKDCQCDAAAPTNECIKGLTWTRALIFVPC